LGFSNSYIIGFVTVLCLICSLAVSVTAVQLKPRQDHNKELDMNMQVVRVAGLVEPGEELTPERVIELFQQIESRLVDRRTGEFVEGDAAAYDARKAAKDPEASEAMTAAEFKPTQVKRLPDVLEVYVVNVPGKECVVLPIHGYGLWTTLYGFIALKKDLSEVVGIAYYEHGETPGLGGEVDNPSWKAQFPGKRPFTDDGDVQLTVKKAGQAAAGSDHQIDGLSGATITTVGVDRMLKLWLGEHGYGKFLERLKEAA
jgi:Na+-transporting NADH:ubiquinone oxidoreductase subunit C